MISTIDRLSRQFVEVSGRVWRLGMPLALTVLLGACGGGGGGGGEAPVDTSSIVVPTLSITSDAPAVAKSAFNLSFNFTGPVTIYSADGVLPWATNNTNAVVDKSTFRKVSDTRYTVTVTPANWKKGDWTLFIPAGAYTDATGVKYSTLSASVTQAIDTQMPFASFSASPASGQAFYTGPTLVTISFSTLLDADLTVGALALSAFKPDTEEPIASPGVISNFVKASGTNEKNVYTFLLTPAAGRSRVVVNLPAGVVRAGGMPNEGTKWEALFIVP